MTLADIQLPARPLAEQWLGQVLPALALAMALLLSQTGLDMSIQRWFWLGPASGWMIDATSAIPRAMFYSGPKILLAVAGTTALVVAVAGFWMPGLRRLQRELALVGLALALVPTVASKLKAVTDVYCPSQTDAFGGRYVHVPPFQVHPEAERRPGRCFPAGHASGGFALLALAFVNRRRWYRLAGVAAGLGTGGAMGIYQMAKGAHFLSHTLTTAALAWLLVSLLAIWMRLPRRTMEEPACR